MTMANEQEMQQAAAEMAEKQFQKDADEITKLGRDTFGAKVFDDAVDTLAAKLGPGIRAFTQIASGFDSPHQLVVKIASDERRLDAMARMTPAQAATEIARAEAELAPHGTTRGGHTPAWKQLAKSENAILSDSEWGNGQSDRLTEDQWQKNWEMRQKRRAANSPQPLGSRARG
jgi:hypothetical protein